MVKLRLFCCVFGSNPWLAFCIMVDASMWKETSILQCQNHNCKVAEKWPRCMNLLVKWLAIYLQAGGRTCEASSLVQLECGFGWLNLSAPADVIVEVPGVKPKSWIGCYMQILEAIHIFPVLSPLSSSHFLISESNNLSCSPHGTYVHLSLSPVFPATLPDRMILFLFPTTQMVCWVFWVLQGYFE